MKSHKKKTLSNSEVKMKILNYGSCNIDYVYMLDHIVRKGETEACDALNVFPGGKGHFGVCRLELLSKRSFKTVSN